MAPVRFSVVIPAFNEEKNIGKCLEALTRQTTREPFEVILVDNGSTDGTVREARRFAKRLRLRIVRERRRGRGAARTRGFREAEGAILLSTDADAMVPPRWIAGLTRILLRDASAAAVTGTPRITDCAPMQNAVFNATIPHFLRANLLLLRHHGLSGFSFAIRKDAYERAGGFNPNTDAYEDLDLALRVHHVGKILFSDRYPVEFSGRRFKNGLLKGWLEYCVTFVQKFILRKERVLLRNL